jgi:hypothetical protein
MIAVTPKIKIHDTLNRIVVTPEVTDILPLIR